MPKPENIIDSAALARVQDIDFIHEFEQGVSALLTVLGIFEPKVLRAGTQIQSYEVTGVLQPGNVPEGEDIPLSKYIQTKGKTYTVDLREYRKATTAQAILKFGYEAAVGQTDHKMIRDIQGVIRSQLFNFLADGTGTATGATFQQAFAMAWGTLANKLSELDTDGTPVYFANPLDLARYLGSAAINNVETAFGFTYLRNFLGLGTCIFDAKVPQGTIYCTPAENINAYAVDLSELARAGLSFEISEETGLIGVHHTGRYQNGTSETYADTGLLLFPEVSNFIVKATIDPFPAMTVESATGSMYGKQVSAYQTGVTVDADGKVTGTLKKQTSGQQAEYWGEGYFLCLKWSNPDAAATSLKVGLEPSQGSGLIECISDTDRNGSFKITDPSVQNFVIVQSNATKTTTQTFDLSGLVFAE